MERTPPLHRNHNVGDRVKWIDLRTREVVGTIQFGRRCFTAEAGAGYTFVVEEAEKPRTKLDLDPPGGV